MRANLRAEVQALTFPVRRAARYRLHALANDTLERFGRPARYEENLREQWRRILRASESTLGAMPPAGAPRILFGTMFGAGFSTRPVDATLAMATRLRGATPIVLACDQTLPACEWNPFGNHEPDPGQFGTGNWRNGNLHMCRSCTLKLSESHDLPGLERVSLRDFVEPGDVERAAALASGVGLGELRDVTHGDIQVGEHAYSSLLRAEMRGVPRKDERTLWLARRYLTSAIVYTEAGERLFRVVRPDRFVAADGVYLTAGTLCELARKRGIHVVVHGVPYRKGTVWLSHHESYHRALINEKNDRWEQFEMTPERTKVADDYLASKYFVARDYVASHRDSLQDERAIREELGLDGRPLVSLYTNILWDAQLYYRFNVYSNMLEWLFETVRFFRDHPDRVLAIRLHPGEAPGGFPTNQPLLPEIEREFPTLPENVRVVRPESKVSSYVLGTMSKAALIYGARMGVELVMLGIPVVVAGEAFMRGKGFSIDPKSREEYLALLERIEHLPPPSDEAKERARRWYYHYFFRMMLPFPFSRAEPTSMRLDFDSLEELLPGRSTVLDLACQGIIDGTTPFEWDELDRAL